jgi:hypothetical protein
VEIVVIPSKAFAAPVADMFATLAPFAFRALACLAFVLLAAPAPFVAHIHYAAMGCRGQGRSLDGGGGRGGERESGQSKCEAEARRYN